MWKYNCCTKIYNRHIFLLTSKISTRFCTFINAIKKIVKYSDNTSSNKTNAIQYHKLKIYIIINNQEIVNSLIDSYNILLANRLLSELATESQRSNEAYVTRQTIYFAVYTTFLHQLHVSLLLYHKILYRS